MPETNLKLFKNMLLLLCFFTIIGILSLSCCSFYWSDDYAYMNDLNKNGIINNCIIGYFTWDGRYLTFSALLQGFFLKYFKVEFITFIWNICTLITGFLLYKIIKTLKPRFFINTDYKILTTAMFVIFYWLTTINHSNETIFWATGGVYSFSNLLNVIWILFFLKFQEQYFHSYQKVLFLLFSFIVGGLSQNNTIGIVTLILILLIEQHFKNKFNFIILLFIIGGLLHISLAPGNLLRLQCFGVAKSDYISFYQIGYNLLKIVFLYLKSSFYLIASSIIFVAGFFYLNNKTISPKFLYDIYLWHFKTFISQFKWFLVACSTVSVFILTPELVSDRTMIFFNFFMIIFFIDFIGDNLLVDRSENNIANELRTFVCFLMIIIISNILVIKNLIIGSNLKSQITAREQLLQKSIGKTINVEKINNVKMSECFQFSDYDKEATFIKESQEEYFNVKINVVE